MGTTLYKQIETEEEREEVKRKMMYFRSIGDMKGFQMMLIILQGGLGNG